MKSWSRYTVVTKLTRRADRGDIIKEDTLGKRFLKDAENMHLSHCGMMFRVLPFTSTLPLLLENLNASAEIDTVYNPPSSLLHVYMTLESNHVMEKLFFEEKRIL